MPIIASEYSPAFRFLKNRHVQTTWQTFFRYLRTNNPRRERVDLADGDFLDIDWFERKFSRLAIISHGMEGSSESIYVKGAMRNLLAHGWDVAAWNFRGCSGEPNRLIRFYHSGASEDLKEVVNHVANLRKYTEIALLGFSIGGNITLKYLGEEANALPKELTKAVVISTPCDLADAAKTMALPHNWIYMQRFLRLFKSRMLEKSRRFPSHYSMEGYSKIKDFKAFDDRYTAPIHGFGSAENYWKVNSSKNFISAIRTKTLILNALDDPFLGSECYPTKSCSESDFVWLETPQYGGHVGFVSLNPKVSYWSEKRTVDFLGE